MRKQNNNFQLNSGGTVPESLLLETTTDTLANNFKIIKYSSYFSIVIFITLVITFLIIISNFIYNLRSELINAHNTQKLCKQEIYENETTRNKLYKLLSNQIHITTLQKSINNIVISIQIIYTLAIILITLSNNESLFKTTKELYEILIMIFIFIIIISVFVTLIPTFINFANEDKSISSISYNYIKSFIAFSLLIIVMLLIMFKKNSISPQFIILSSILVLIISGIYKFNNELDSINILSIEYSSNLEFLKDKVFTPEKLNQIILSYNRADSTTSTESTSTQGPLVILEESIMRRLLHLDQTGEILNMDEAKTKYNNLRNTDSGRIDLIGYIQFIRNTEDYYLLQKIVCGTNLCNQGIGYHIKNLPDKDFDQFITALKSSTRPTTNNNNEYTTWLNTLKTTVTKYDNELSKQLGKLEMNDKLWPLLLNITTKDDIQQCECKENPLNIQTTADKVKVLSILNYLANLSNGNNIVDVQKKVDNLQYYLIVFYSILFYILFHITYKIFDSKLVIGSYFGILLIISVSLVLVSRL